MRLEALLLPRHVRCRLDARDRLTVLRALADALSNASGAVASADLLDAINKREKLGPVCLGKGLAFVHVRTEKVPDLALALATTPAGVEDFQTPDGEPVRLVTLFLIPKKHSDLYLRVTASLLAAILRPNAIDAVLAAETPEALLAALTHDEAEPDVGEVLDRLLKDDRALERVAQALSRIPAVDVAGLVEDLTPDERGRCLGLLDPARAADITRHMHLVPLVAALRRMPPEGAARLLSYVDSARIADILQRLPKEEQAGILKHLTTKPREQLQALMKYPESTAGGVMKAEVLAVREDATVESARKIVAAFPDPRQTDLFVVSAENRLVGYCSLHALLGADPATAISGIMDRNVPSVPPERDQEELRHMITRMTQRAIPVVAPDGTLLGVVTQDDLLDIVEHEAYEDLALMVGTNLVHPLHTPTLTRARLRMPWLLLTLAGELFIALVITKVFRPTLEKAVVIAAFIPAIMATGGNIGLQATSVVIRGLAMGTLKRRHTMRLLLGEIRLGLLLGACCGTIAAVVAYAINWNYHEVLKMSVSVFLAMMSATLATSFVGVMEPLVLARLKFDPATACGVFVTVFNDLFGSTIYLLIAMLMNFQPPTPPPT